MKNHLFKAYLPDKTSFPFLCRHTRSNQYGQPWMCVPGPDLFRGFCYYTNTTHCYDI